MRILIVEDQLKFAELLKEGLSQESFAVDIASDGPEGLAAAEAENYDLIVLDRMLPDGADGIDICRQLRADGNHVPIIMLTAKDQVTDRIDGLNSGADDYLVKPFSFNELLARIRALLRRPSEALGEVLMVGNLALNTRTKTAERNGRSIHLSAKEYAVFEYLLRNKGQVVSKTELINHVWDFDADILPSTVEVFIVHLRAKIEKPFTGPRLIYTVRGFGYTITDSPS